MPELGPNRYGKSGVRLLKVLDGGGVVDVTLRVACQGDFAGTHTVGDNRQVVPTDTMRNTAFAFAQDHLDHELEGFCGLLADHFLAFEQVARVEVEARQRRWGHIGSHSHAFASPSGDLRVARVSQGEEGRVTEAGIEGLLVLKTTGSSFTGFVRDRYTTLPEAEDRLLATSVTAGWRYSSPPSSFTAAWESVRATLVESFASHPSRSVQEQGYLMGSDVLAGNPEVAEVHLQLPNKHHLAFDLTRFGMEDRGVVFWPVDEPYGDIALTVRR